MKRSVLLSLVGLLVLRSPALGASSSGPFSDYFSVSAPSVVLGATEGIYGFTVQTSRSVILRTKVPFQWNVSVDNSDGGRSQLSAHAIVGNSAFRPGNLRFFRHFIEIGKIANPVIELPFKIEVILEITDDSTDKERTVTVPMDRLRLSKLSEP
jgi:hypothetical protein